MSSENNLLMLANSIDKRLMSQSQSYILILWLFCDIGKEMLLELSYSFYSLLATSSCMSWDYISFYSSQVSQSTLYTQLVLLFSNYII